MIRTTLAFISASLLACSLAADAQTTPPQSVLRELIVLQVDRYGDTANDPRVLSTTLTRPIQHLGRVKRVDDQGGYQASPMPLGFITLAGAIDAPVKLRLTLPDRRDTFHAHWPGSSIKGPHFIEWQQVEVGEEALDTAPLPAELGWLSRLRDGEDRTWLQSRGERTQDRFLLYDAAIRFKPSVALSQTEQAYRLSLQDRQRSEPPLSVLLRNTPAGWLSDAVATPWPGPDVQIADASDAQDDGNSDAALSIAQALSPIVDLLDARGYNEQEVALAADMIASSGLDAAAMSLVYVLPTGEIDQHIRLQIKPMPDEVIRTAIVVLNNVDPDLNVVVNGLLDNLASESWAKRDHAQRELIGLGQAAIQKVRQLKSAPDPEVAFRAQQIIDAYELKMQSDP